MAAGAENGGDCPGGGYVAIKGLAIIGESINDSVPSTGRLFESQDMAGILALAKAQDEGGAAYIDVNIGRRPPDLMADLVKRIQEVTEKPLSIDTPDPVIARAGLEAYDLARAGGIRPLLNSISPLRLPMFDLFKEFPFMPMLLVSESEEGGQPRMNRNAQEVYECARFMLENARRLGLKNDQCILDPGIGPLASDLEGMLQRIMGALRLFKQDNDFKGVHVSVGLSNFTHMLPARCPDGSPVKGPLESAFLTRAMPLGLDMVVGSVKRKYEILPEGNKALACFDEMVKLQGYDLLERLQEFYSG